MEISSEGFLIAPVGNKIFPVLLGLGTDDGTSINASLQAVGGATRFTYFLPMGY